MTAFNEVYSMFVSFMFQRPVNRLFHLCFNDPPFPFPVCTMKHK